MNDPAFTLDLDFEIIRHLSAFERGIDGLYHYLFCTTRLGPNGRCMFFIGSHSSPDLYNDYLGDGRVLRQVLSAWGSSGCRKFILSTFRTKELAEDAERSIVTQALVDRPESYNDVTGAEMVAKRHQEPKLKGKPRPDISARMKGNQYGRKHPISCE